jgi:hypothetical protein
MHFSFKGIKMNALRNLIDLKFVSWIQNADKLCLTMIINYIDSMYENFKYYSIHSKMVIRKKRLFSGSIWLIFH